MKTMNELKQLAKAKVTKCRVCPICNGLACKGEIPGVGGKGTGSSFVRNVEQLKKVKIRMDVTCGAITPDTSSELFGNKVSLPVYAAPIAGITNNFGAEITDTQYTADILDGCIQAKTIGFTGDGKFIEMFTGPLKMIDERNGLGICTMKPWVKEGIDLRLDYVNQSNVLALATDIDSAGLPLLRNSEIPVETKSTAALKELKEALRVPLIVKGIMSVESALRAKEAGADAIVVSNHGGRVLDETLSTIEVLEEIAQALEGSVTILVDGGFRSGHDVFKALALGADGVLIGRPVSLAAIADGAQGVADYFENIRKELMDVMLMSGCATISDITRDKIAVVKD
ncbi:MAG: alpha-hydroxy-acid oxidizing protein [Erysipelotrichaceae bacterium]|nr:alpha-hydroxy-acid oxidizing protein [Erysipelotrichaceae bacterium]